MNALRRFGRFWWDFMIGDDWRVAAGVVIALAVSGVLAEAGVPAWWILPVAVAGVLYLSLLRETR